ncbi:hypothetical protein HYN56_11450 [Flavobacterium crocinum]|uniref:Uncharacterized protein n=1 Tax=Flavobacterium crocinum TaxID=2183896 RepID=A0A2S1YLC2_9FLAO|nr:hypothetical protein [Flavobacterium crocinum]AWK04806.1 hypothetical protein HYN56_11450 [Flavobacterium crocinum]
MEGHFEDLALTVRAKNLQVPYHLKDECLFLTVRTDVLGLLCDPATEIYSFGPAPDNTADGKDELLEDGVFYRIIGYQNNLGINMESSAEEILDAFHFLIKNFEPKWTTIFTEEGPAKKEITIEMMYQEEF